MCAPGFIAWSILTALATLIWFFPLFNMSLSGEEAAVVATLAPVFLGIGPLRRLVLNTQVCCRERVETGSPLPPSRY